MTTPTQPIPPECQADLDVPLWGAKAIGAPIGRNERQTFHCLEQGTIDGTKVGQLWTSTKRRVYRSVGMIK